MNIAKDTIYIDGLKIKTDVGYIKCNAIHKTYKFKKYIILFESGREVECADNHCFITNSYKEIHAKDINIGDRIISENDIDVVFDVFDTGEYEEMFDITLCKHHLYYTNGLLSHNSNIMSNIIRRQVSNNINVALASLEMSVDMYSQRFDANFANIDINRMYINKKIKNEFLKRITEVKKNPNLGELYIKEYPTGKATVNDYRIWLRELIMRGHEIDIFYCDYISLMKSETKNTGDLYKDGKNISEELRALGFEFNIPVVTVAQINRSGTFLDFDALDMNSISESFGIPATADSILIQGYDEDDMIYKNELKWKCVKNRLGGRVGDTGKLYVDSKSLRMYDETELDQWLDDVKDTGDTREMFEREI